MSDWKDDYCEAYRITTDPVAASIITLALAITDIAEQGKLLKAVERIADALEPRYFMEPDKVAVI